MQAIRLVQAGNSAHSFEQKRHQGSVVSPREIPVHLLKPLGIRSAIIRGHSHTKQHEPGPRLELLGPVEDGLNVGA
jgi:hypothetical protein